MRFITLQAMCGVVPGAGYTTFKIINKAILFDLTRQPHRVTVQRATMWRFMITDPERIDHILMPPAQFMRESLVVPALLVRVIEQPTSASARRQQRINELVELAVDEPANLDLDPNPNPNPDPNLNPIQARLPDQDRVQHQPISHRPTASRSNRYVSRPDMAALLSDVQRQALIRSINAALEAGEIFLRRSAHGNGRCVVNRRGAVVAGGQTLAEIAAKVAIVCGLNWRDDLKPAFGH